ncbi:TPA: hypothetical protein ACGSTL_001191 [Vibrio parahaemolyticus]|uniref:hypothetical protein n=1 Tax=Vibrio campbellii TaxID=680 RepID=UPI001F07A34D|nr:hypothetical protein [Vibrio campbellii]UMM06612.1 hypothetical protein MKR81_27065 [Vibrio campbellii]
MSIPSNTLLGHQCPECGQQEELIMRVEANTYMDDEGTDFYADKVKTSGIEWNVGHHCQCPQCGFRGKVFQFRNENLISVLSQAGAIEIDGHIFHGIEFEADTMSELVGGDEETKEGTALVLEKQWQGVTHFECFLSVAQLELAEYDKQKHVWLIPDVQFHKDRKVWVKTAVKAHVLKAYMLTLI